MILTKGSFSTCLSKIRLNQDSSARCILSFQPQLYRHLDLHSPQAQNCIEQIQNLLKDQKSKPKEFIKLKIVILLHRLLMKFKEYGRWILQHPLQIGEYPGELRQLSDYQKIGHLAWTYYRMVLKYCSSQEIYNYSRDRVVQSDPDRLIQKAYLLMNLIKESSPLAESINYFGRYHIIQYQIMLDVVSAITAQLSRLYDSLYSCVEGLRINIDALNSLQSEQFLTIIQEIPSINEVIWLHFYNRYYHKHACSLGVPLLNPDNENYQITINTLQQRKKNSLRAALKPDFDLSSFESTYFSFKDSQEQTIDF